MFRSIAIFYLTCFHIPSAVQGKCSSAHKSKTWPVPAPRQPPPVPPEQNYPEAIFHVTEYGAVADGETDSTSVCFLLYLQLSILLELLGLLIFL